VAEPEAVRPILARVVQAWPAEVRAGLAAAQLRMRNDIIGSDIVVQGGPEPMGALR